MAHVSKPWQQLVFRTVERLLLPTVTPRSSVRLDVKRSPVSSTRLNPRSRPHYYPPNPSARNTTPSAAHTTHLSGNSAGTARKNTPPSATHRSRKPTRSLYHTFSQYFAQYLNPYLTSLTQRPLHLSLSPRWRSLLKKNGGWSIALVFCLILLGWNLPLFLATGAGMGTMVAVYLLSTSRSNLNWVALSRLGSQLRQPVLLAISTGAIAALLVYFSFSIWSATENHWLASGFILQSAATLAVLSLLIWQTLAKLTGRDQVNLAPTLLQLTEENHLKRLIAVRQLEQWLQQRRLDLAEQTNVAACLEYLLHYEQDELIREAAFAALQLTRSPGDREKTTLTAGSGIPMSKMSQNPQVVRVRPEAVPSQNEIQRSQTQTESSPQQA